MTASLFKRLLQAQLNHVVGYSMMRRTRRLCNVRILVINNGFTSTKAGKPLSDHTLDRGRHWRKALTYHYVDRRFVIAHTFFPLLKITEKKCLAACPENSQQMSLFYLSNIHSSIHLSYYPFFVLFSQSSTYTPSLPLSSEALHH